MSQVEVVIRRATLDDEPELLSIDAETQNFMNSPEEFEASESRSFSAKFLPSDHLVAVVATRVVGYVRLTRPTSLASNAHVLHIGGLAVAPGWQGLGVGRGLIAAAVAEARSRGASKLGLRVLAGNESALRLYVGHGFETEGILRGEFILDGVAVDDVLMALRLVKA